MAVLALCILAVSVLVLRTGVFGRWLGYLGGACSAVMVAAVVAQYGAFTTPLSILWTLCLAVAIWRQPVADASRSGYWLGVFPGGRDFAWDSDCLSLRRHAQRPLGAIPGSDAGLWVAGPGRPGGRELVSLPRLCAAVCLGGVLALVGCSQDNSNDAPSRIGTATNEAAAVTEDLPGRLLFSRFDENTHTFLSTHIARADGGSETEGAMPGPEGGGRWSWSGDAIAVMTVLADDRIGTAIIRPDGTVERVLEIADASLNLVCTGGPRTTSVWPARDSTRPTRCETGSTASDRPMAADWCG